MMTNVPATTGSGLTSPRIARAPDDFYVRFLQRAVDLIDRDRVRACGHQTADDLGVRRRGILRAEVDKAVAQDHVFDGEAFERRFVLLQTLREPDPVPLPLRRSLELCRRAVRDDRASLDHHD